MDEREPNEGLNPFQLAMSFVNPFSGEDGWQKMQREAEGQPLPPLGNGFRL